VLTWLLHEDGVDLNGVVLQSAILDYSQAGNPVGTLPTFAADAYVHKKVTLSPPPKDLPSFLEQVEKFARDTYGDALNGYPKIDPKTLQFLSEILGIPTDVLRYWKLDPTGPSGTLFLNSLLQDQGQALGSYDGRVTADESGIAGSVDPNSGSNDPTMTAVGGVYTTMWNVYLNEQLQYTSTSPFMDLNDQAFKNWDFSHVDPTGAQKGGAATLYTAGDLAAAMALNPYLKVFCAGGYYDAVTAYFQTILTFEGMPLKNPRARKNLTVRNYPSGHMVYLDDDSRTKMKADLAQFYDDAAGTATGKPAAAAAAMRTAAQSRQISYSPYRRRFGRTPY
jgi:carboxypeptidase C (cathepsin A)